MRARVNSVQLTASQETLVSDLEPFGDNAWKGHVEVSGVDRSSDRDALKDHVRSSLRTSQNGFCAYCGLKFREKYPHIDHVAPKKRFKTHTFNVKNLVLACHHCNVESKSTFNPVVRSDGDYMGWEFCFVHPILDDISLHLVRDRYFVWIDHITEKGRETISKFGLKEPTMLEERAKQAHYDNRQNTPKELLDLLEKVATYVP